MYSITKDPLSLGIIGLMGYPCCFYGFVCWPHSGSERKEKLISQMHFGFFSNQLWSIFIDMAGGRAGLLSTNDFIFYLLLSFSWGLVRAFLGPTIFSLLSLLVPKSIS
jgi:hypothetical protein